MTIFLFVIFSIFIVMKKIVKLTEDDLTKIVKRVIQEETQLTESKKLKTLALGLGLTVGVMLPSCSSGKYSEDDINKQAMIFMKKLNEIDEITPEDLTLSFMETVKNNEGFKDWDENMVNRQISAFYRIDSEKHLKLCAEMIAYQLKKCGEDKKVKVQVGEYVDKLKGGKLDQIDSLILKSFEEGVESLQKQSEYESRSGLFY
jgi:hypothetical protein